MKLLWLVRVELVIREYMEEPRRSETMRLVWSDSADDAVDAVERDLETNDPYGTSVEANVFEITQAIGDPNG